MLFIKVNNSQGTLTTVLGKEFFRNRETLNTKDESYRVKFLSADMLPFF